MRDPIATIRAIYARYGETPSDLHVRRMQVWLKERGQHSEGRHVYDPQDFGWTYDGLADDFSTHMERFGIIRE